MNKAAMSVVVVSLWVTGCAHQPKPVEAEKPVPVVHTPARKEVAPAPAQVPVEPDLGSLLAGSTLYFDFNQALLTDGNQQRLRQVADALRKDGKAAVRIAGHCDERGTEEYNLALGQQRAESARRYLVTLGVEADRVQTVSYGEEQPALSGTGEEVWAKNRRDEISLVQ